MAMHVGLQSLFAALANRGVQVLAWYEVDGAIGLVIASRHVVEVAREAACGRPYDVADMLASVLPRLRVPRDWDASNVPQVAPLTVRWWEFLRWLLERDCARELVEVQR